MRSFLVLSVALSSGLSVAAAQYAPPTPSRWTFSAGPEWSATPPHPAARLWGARFRAEYDLTKPNSVFGIRLESGARWSPTQSYWFPVFNGTNVSTHAGTEQRLDLMLGLSASLSPFPNSRVSPYVTIGVFGRQQWTNAYRVVFGETPSAARGRISLSEGDILTSLGVGLRLRLGGRTFQVELRTMQPDIGLTVGTRLPF